MARGGSPAVHIEHSARSERSAHCTKELEMQTSRTPALALCVLPLLSLACGQAPDGTVTATSTQAPAGLHDVLLVGNSVAGTVSVLDGHTFANLGSINVVP